MIVKTSKMTIKIKDSKWRNLPRWRKRIDGFFTYLVCAFYSLKDPEAVDMVLFKELNSQFEIVT